MPAASGPDVACEYDGAGVALELAALAAFVVLLRYAAVLYANHLLATLCVDDGLPAGQGWSYSDAWVFPGTVAEPASHKRGGQVYSLLAISHTRTNIDISLLVKHTT